MKYYVTSIGDCDEYIIGAVEDKDEAIKIARNEWLSMTKYDRKKNQIEVRMYVNDIEDEDCDCFDYDTVEWRKYYINFHTGEGNKYVMVERLSDAEEIADEYACYTQQPITIESDEVEIAYRPWWGVAFNEEEHKDEYPIPFGDYGYYGDWVEL